MKKNLIITCFVLLFAAQMQAQTEELITTPRFRLGIELGADALFGEANKLPQIRENRSYYHYYDDYDYYCGFIYDENETDFFYIGVKPEYLIHRRVAVAMGIRFSFNQIVYDSDKEYFLWKLRESGDGLNTSYLRIKDITQRNYYVGIPMEIKIFPREMDYFVRHYFILGAVFNFLVASTNDVSFKNPAMNKYTSEVSNQIDGLSTFHGNLYGGFGLKIGRTNHPFGNIEFHFPVVMLASDKPNSLLKTDGAFGFGFQTSLQIPLFKNHQLTYTVIND
jgi:hypothetical protein